MAQILYPIYTITYLALLIWAIFLWFRKSSLSLAIIFALLVGLLYDNAIIGYGIYIGEGDLLLNMNKLRFLLAAILSPLLILAALDQSKGFEINNADKRWVQVLFLLLTLILIGMGLVTFTALNLEPIYYAGTLRYVDTTGGSPILTMSVLVVTAVLGSIIWYKGRWPWLFAGTLVMIIATAISASITEAVISSGSIIVLLLAYLFTEKELKNRNDIPTVVSVANEHKDTTDSG